MAVQEYNNVLLDGKPMQIELVADSKAMQQAALPTYNAPLLRALGVG